MCVKILLASTKNFIIFGLPRAIYVASVLLTSHSVGYFTPNDNQERSNRDVWDGHLNGSQYCGRQRHKGQDPARDLSINVLETFSVVTKFAYETTSQLFGNGHNNGFGGIEQRNYNESSMDRPQKPSTTAKKVHNEAPVPSDPLEVTFHFM